MKSLAIAITAALPLMAHASCFTDSTGATICSDPPEAFCLSPNVFDPVNRRCAPPIIVPAPGVVSGVCTLTLVYTDSDPLNPAVTATPGCSDKAREYALEAARTRLRWALQR